jgi:hypothetical protein
MDVAINADDYQAHWFDMAKFWAKAAKIVKPEGTVALWTCCQYPETY